MLLNAKYILPMDMNHVDQANCMNMQQYLQTDGTERGQNDEPGLVLQLTTSLTS
jgi:hypothetical protein